MTTLTLSMWLGGVLLESLLLVRGFQNKLSSRFPIFYTYIAVVLIESLVCFPLYYRGTQEQYALAYWTFVFFAVIVGSLVVFEIYRQALRQYPGTLRMARNALYFVFALAFAKALVYKADGTLAWLAQAPAEIERSLRVVQIFAILVIIGVLLLYAIPTSRNSKGILVGYALFVASSVFQLSLVSYFGVSFHKVWLIIQPFAYLLFLMVWVVTLWSAAEEPIATPPPDSNYTDVASGTSRELANLNFDLRKAPRR